MEYEYKVHLWVMLVFIEFAGCIPQYSLAKALTENVITSTKDDGWNPETSTSRQAHPLAMDKLANFMGCNAANLLEAVNVIIMCSSASRGESYYSAVHFPTKLITTQINQEMSMESISNPQVLEKLSQVVQNLNTIVQDDNPVFSLSLQGSSSMTPTAAATIAHTLDFLNEFVDDYDKMAKSQRQEVQTVLSSMPQELPAAFLFLQTVNFESVLERPPLMEETHQRDEHRPPTENKQNSGKAWESGNRDTSFLPSNSANLEFSNSKSCAFTDPEMTLTCSPTVVQHTLEAIVVTFANAIKNFQDARNMLLNTVMQAHDSRSPSATGNQLVWSSLGTSERSLVDIASAILTALRTLKKAQLKINADKEYSNNNNNDDDSSAVSSFTNAVSEFFPKSSNLQSSSLDHKSMENVLQFLRTGSKKIAKFFGFTID